MSYNRYKNTQKRKNYLLIHNKEKYDRVSIILPKGTKEKIKRLDIKSSLKPYPLSRTFLREREKQQFLPEPLLLSFY